MQHFKDGKLGRAQTASIGLKASTQEFSKFYPVQKHFQLLANLLLTYTKSVSCRR